MELKPETVKKLREDYPELVELIKYLDACAAELNTITDIDDSKHTVNDMGLEVLARKFAYEKVIKMIEPLLQTETRATGINTNEYAVDVDPPER